jgi:hypothetical protein
MPLTPKWKGDFERGSPANHPVACWPKSFIDIQEFIENNIWWIEPLINQERDFWR